MVLFVLFVCEHVRCLNVFELMPFTQLFGVFVCCLFVSFVVFVYLFVGWFSVGLRVMCCHVLSVWLFVCVLGGLRDTSRRWRILYA